MNGALLFITLYFYTQVNMNWHRHNLKYNFQKRMLCQCHKIPYCDQWAWIEFLIWTDHPVSFLFVFSFTRTRSNLKLKWNRVTCVLKMGWHTHLLESCHWHWHATQSSNEASFHLPPPLGWPSALSLFQGHWLSRKGDVDEKCLTGAHTLNLDQDKPGQPECRRRRQKDFP